MCLAANDTAMVLMGVLSSGLFHYRRTLRYLHIYQQDGYENPGFIAWFKQNGAFDKRATITLVGFAIAAVAAHFSGCSQSPLYQLLWPAGLAFAFLVLAFKEEDPRSEGKLKLKMTARAQRILRTAQVLNLIIAATLYTVARSWSDVSDLCLAPALVAVVQLYPLFLVCANSLLSPYENSVQARFASEARLKLNLHNPFIIGITGSYGKTSTKHILADILNVVEPTFTTPGSVNTYMGITQQIREKLTEHHKYAVIEMGAYYMGSIKRLCGLTPPKAAIITGIGLMHLERFGDQDTIQKAKSELAQAVPADGILVCNGDDARCRKIAQLYPKKTTLFYGFDTNSGQLDASMLDVTADEAGSQFTIRWQGKDYRGRTRLLGKPMLANVLACFTMACALGLEPKLVLAAIAGIKAEKNRLQPEKQTIKSPAADGAPAQVLTLNDAYNSNPIGFAAALEVLGNISGERKVLVTPGMIELGELQAAENARAASIAGKVCDLVVVVGDTNKEALFSGLKNSGLEQEKYLHYTNMADALQYVYGTYCKGGEVVLVENDLPDRFECPLHF